MGLNRTNDDGKDSESSANTMPSALPFKIMGLTPSGKLRQHHAVGLTFQDYGTDPVTNGTRFLSPFGLKARNAIAWAGGPRPR
jgi:hypothetical protein